MEIGSTPPGDVTIDPSLVHTLLEDQHPDLAHLPLADAGHGWDNHLYTLGNDLAVRLPRRAAAAGLIEHEQRWLPDIATRLPLPVPVPVRVGVPGRGYPWRWSVLPWLKGRAADQHAPHVSQARPLAAFLRSLHVPAPADAPTNPVRGVPLRQRAAAVAARMQRLASTTSLITSQLTHIWDVALHAPLDVPPTWIHGDLHPRNVLVEHGGITGIIDWGDITSGDCATDLASIWMLFAEPHARQEALAAYPNVSEATLQRAKGWAVLFGVMLLDAGLNDNPRNAMIGVRTLRRVTEAR